MKFDFLNFLECQDCSSSLKVKEVYTKKDNKIINGIIECDCATYPILDGILIFKRPSDKDYMSSTSYLTGRLKIGDIEGAIGLSLAGKKPDKTLLWLYLLLNEIGFFKRPLSPILSLIRNLKRKRYRRYADKNLTFFDLMDILGWGTWGDYLKHRFSCQSFWSLYPFIPLMEKKNDMVLDMMCGTGHASFTIPRYVNPKSLVCMDQDYTLLFIAKKYFVRDAEFICADANSPLPFKNGIFSSILAIDSFHYVSNRTFLARETERCLEPNGLILPLHLHNALLENISEGYALSPSKWAALFNNVKTKSVPENNLIEDFLLKRKLDLTRVYSQKELNSSNAISMVGTNDEKIFDIYGDIDVPSLKGANNLIINPIYNINHGRDHILLKMRIPNELYKREYPLTMRFLPNEYTISGNILRYIKGNRMIIPKDVPPNDLGGIGDMVRNYMLIDVPEMYV